jgi:hypothetical protein
MCTVCGAKFKSAKGMVDHVARRHGTQSSMAAASPALKAWAADA